MRDESETFSQPVKPGVALQLHYRDAASQRDLGDRYLAAQAYRARWEATGYMPQGGSGIESEVTFDRETADRLPRAARGGA